MKFNHVFTTQPKKDAQMKKMMMKSTRRVQHGEMNGQYENERDSSLDNISHYY